MMPFFGRNPDPEPDPSIVAKGPGKTQWLEHPREGEKCRICMESPLYTFTLVSGRLPLCEDCIKHGDRTCALLWGHGLG